MKSFLIKNRHDLMEWFTKFHIMKPEKLYPFTLKMEKGDTMRNLDQNALVNIWYRDIAKQAGDRSTQEVTRECKLTCGVPILRAESEEFRAMYDKVMKNHDYETKLEIMDWLPVSSIMTQAQMTEYMDTIYHKYTAVGFQLSKGRKDHE
jgi:hypothetical protein